MATTPTDYSTWSTVQLAAAHANLECAAQKYDLANRGASADALRGKAAPYVAEIKRRGKRD